MKKIICFILILIMFSVSSAQRIKDIANIKGVNSEQLIGYGLVVGLAGTGDTYRSLMTSQSIVSMLKRFGITISEANLRTRNVGAVMVTARIVNSLRQGSEFDVVVSSMGDASSLMGGTLLLTTLSGKDGKVYATSQGPVSIGGFDINTSSGGRVAKNHSLTGRIPSGGIMETDFGAAPLNQNEISILLREPDFTTANNIVTALNTQFGNETASAVDATEIKVKVPQGQENGLTGFISKLEVINVQKDVAARVVLNERTGTVVAGNNVIISPVSISHGNLNITIRSFPIISQPNPLSGGETTMFNNLVPSVEQDGNNSISISGATNAQEIANALNSLKVSPRDIIAIFQALKEAGALTAELIIL